MRRWPVLVLLVGCGSKAAPPAPSSSAVTTVDLPPAPPAPPPTASASPSVAPTSAPRPLGPLTIVPPVPPLERDSMMDHCRRMGWVDGSSLGCCFAVPMDEGEACVVDGPHGPSSTPKQAMARGAVKATSRWVHAGEVDVVWQVVPYRDDPAPGTSAYVKVGVRVRGEAPSYPIALKGATWDKLLWSEIHIELMGISPDGAWFGVMAHAFMGEWMNDYPVAIVPVDELVSHAYNDGGFARHKKGEFARAAELFAAAARLDEKARLPRYNLACAYARLGDARVREALDAAMALDVEATKKSARTDPDFDSVRDAAWFRELVGED